MAKQKQPAPQPSAPPWVAGPQLQPEADYAGETECHDPASDVLDLEAFLDEVTKSPAGATPVVEARYTHDGAVPELAWARQPAPDTASATADEQPSVHDVEVADEEHFEAPLPVRTPPRIQQPAPRSVTRQAVGTSWDHAEQGIVPAGTVDWRTPPARPVPGSGWRRWLYLASAKSINLGENPADAAIRELDRKIQTPLDREFSLGVVQLKGGAAKTTTSIGLGNAFAETRPDAIVAIDVNPDRGNMGRRTELRTGSNVFSLIASRRPTRVQDVRAHTNQTSAGLEVLASAQDPAIAQSFSEWDYAGVFGILSDFYSVIISDCGTNITHSATQAVLARADALIIPLDARSDSAEEAVATIDYLHWAYAKDPETNAALIDDQGHQQWIYRHLLARTVVVISHQRPGRRRFDVEKSLDWFRERVMDVHVIPYDPHLEEGGQIIPERLSAATRLAYRELAAKVAGVFPSTYSTDPHLRRAV